MSIPEQELRSPSLTAPRKAVTRDLLLLHGLFYLFGGAWPVVSMRSFEAVTGAKTDKWLVKTTGLLIAAIGGALARAACREKVGSEIKILAIGSAASLAAVDFYYVARRRIPPIYLCDGLAELALVMAWVARTCADKNSK